MGNFIETPKGAAYIVGRYSSPGAALTAIREHYVHPGKYTLILGENEQVWVVTNRDAGRLVSAGYELA